MAEVEEWLRFIDVFSAWLALIDESYVNKLKLCRVCHRDQSEYPCSCYRSKEREGVLLSSAMLCQVGQRAGTPPIGLEASRVYSGRL